MCRANFLGHLGQNMEKRERERNKIEREEKRRQFENLEAKSRKQELRLKKRESTRRQDFQGKVRIKDKKCCRWKILKEFGESN